MKWLYYGGMARRDQVFVLDIYGHLVGTMPYQDWWDDGGRQWWVGEGNDEEAPDEAGDR